MSKTLVISGASRGIGFAMVQLATQQGHRVYALSRTIQSLTQTDLLHPLALDLSNEDEIVAFAAQLQAEGVQIDALINNAGTLENKPFSETTTALFESVYRVNVFGLASLTRLLLPMISSKGHVVNISSMGGIEGSAKFPGLARRRKTIVVLAFEQQQQQQQQKGGGGRRSILLVFGKDDAEI